MWTFTSATILRTASGRTTDFNSGFTSSFDPNEEGRGPMFSKASFGVPQFYPRDLKRRVDEYVVGQDRAKKIISSVLFNHYQGLRRRQYHEEQERKREEKLLRQALARERHAREREIHPVDGPTGVGKTYILETLSKTINVPFTISDCNSFTQAGYIGQDVETCIERLLIEANYDVKAAEHGIVVLDEFDKIAKRETMNGRDVGGEGVQQALLKLVEGTKVTVNVKDTRSAPSSASSSRSASPITTNYTGSSSTSAPQQPPPPPSGPAGAGGAGAKVDQYTVDTSNILFVMCGAFVGLDKTILNRVAKPTMGFGSEIRSRGSSTDSNHNSAVDLPAELFAHLPHRSPATLSDPNTTTTPSIDPNPSPSPSPTSATNSTTSTNKTSNHHHHHTPHTLLDLATPTDLQSFGFIPELIGRIHNITALSPLSHQDLLRVLTEPRNSLVKQYTALFETYPSRLRFTRRALEAIARRAEKSRTGARALRMEVERVLAEAVFDAPMPHVLVTEASVEGREQVGYWGRGGAGEVERRVREEDGEVEGEGEGEGEDGGGAGGKGGREVLGRGDGALGEYREAGQSGA
ncbi:putative atp-dependent clp protease atp-binding subunit clpx protein [Eutypa lata UCREL1]|uniref:Putative atp-dependent clp protease atp-binding subunit clpx protein n=1 Tax=Eutypa lata (strain UCR-EL1) TaxID=1287681 RepID=M7TKL4_EUTLA|nr:putative atp-dependent clp protease atp-binding subunit clpx protein [Eutypa lata UCREL1]